MLPELIPLKLSERWITSLWKQLSTYRKSRGIELDKVNNSILYSDPLALAAVYVEPYCQEINPADRHDEDFFVAREPLFRKISEFLRMKSYQQGNNQLFILSDAGMGKTSSLVMLKLIHLSSFWPKGYSCVIEKLGAETLDSILQIENKRKTLLLLDSLDEDPTAHGRVRERLMEILEATKSFNKVIITCRTQFFPDCETDPLEVPGRIKVGPFVCPSKYISVFDDNQVDAYLLRRFPKGILLDRNKEKRQKARKIISRMGSLRCRPMLLSFIEDLVDANTALSIGSEYALYHALVKNWLIREEGKTGINSNQLLSVCARLAFEMQSRRLVRISSTELNELINEFDVIENVKYLDITGRSLLNKNSDGDYRFSHYSIQEFLVAFFILEMASLDDRRTVYPTDFIKKLLDANVEKIGERFRERTMRHEELVEPNRKRGNADTHHDFLHEKEIISLIAEFSERIGTIDVEAFGADLDVPTYIRNIVIKHSAKERVKASTNQ